MAQEEMSCVKAKVPEKNTLNRLGFFEVAIESIVANVAFMQHFFETTRQISVYEPSHYV